MRLPFASLLQPRRLSCWLLALTLVPQVTWAQEEPNPLAALLGGGSATGSTKPEPEPNPGAMTVSAAPGFNLSDGVGIIRLTDMGGNEVIEMLENLTGKACFRQQNLPQVRITFNSRQPMTRGDAILALESLLAMNGIAITDMGERFLKAVPSSTVQQQVPRMIEYPEDGAPSQSVFSKFYRLDFLSLQEALPLIQPLMTQGAPIPIEKANALLVTDSLVNLQRISEFLERIDRPSPQQPAILFFQLKNTTASDLSRRLQSMQTGPLRRFLDQNTSFDADDRSNQLVIFTHPANETLLRDLIARMDVNVAPATTTRVYRVKHADAGEIVTLIQELITGQKQARTAGAGGSRTPNTGGDANNVVATPTPAPEPAPVTAKMSAAADDNTRSLQFSDFLTITADTRANAILASGTPTDLENLGKMIDDIDVLLAQVRIEVVIAEVSLDNGLNRGIDAFNFSYNRSTTGTGTGATTNPGGNDTVIGIDGPGGTTFPVITFPEFSIQGVLGVAASDGRVAVLSAPTIVTTHNQEATISVGESRPVITSTATELTGSSSLRSTVQFRDIGIELKVKPLIGSNGVVQMEVSQKVESVVGGIEVDGNEQPIIGRRETTSFISVADGKLVVLGGLQSVDVDKRKRRMRILGEIPILGELFTSRTHGESRRELLVFLRPKIITRTEDADADAQGMVQDHTAQRDLNHFLTEGDFRTPKETYRERVERRRREREEAERRRDVLRAQQEALQAAPRPTSTTSTPAPEVPAP